MIPSFLRPERVPYARVEIVPAPVVDYRLYVRHASGTVQVLTFTDASSRALALIALVKLPVDLRTDEWDAEDNDREELCGSTCGTACGYCGGCS